MTIGLFAEFVYEDLREFFETILSQALQEENWREFLLGQALDEESNENIKTCINDCKRILKLYEKIDSGEKQESDLKGFKFLWSHDYVKFIQMEFVKEGRIMYVGKILSDSEEEEDICISKHDLIEIMQHFSNDIDAPVVLEILDN